MIQDILSKYEQVSCQCVNFDKSTLLFSPCVEEDTKRDMCRITGMKVVNHLGRYLEFPSHISRYKCMYLNFLKERVNKMLACWKGNLFSVGGRKFCSKKWSRSFLHIQCIVFVYPRTFVMTFPS